MGGTIPFVLEAFLVACVSVLATYIYLDKRAQSHVRKAQVDADRIRDEAETERRDAAIATKDEAIRLRNELDREAYTTTKRD